MHECAACDCMTQTADGGHHLIIDGDKFSRILGGVPVFRDNERNRLANIMNDIVRQKGWTFRIFDPAVRDYHRHFGDEAAEVLVAPDRNDAGLRARERKIDSANTGMRVNASNETCFEQAVRVQVVGKRAAALNELCISQSRYGCTDKGHYFDSPDLI